MRRCCELVLVLGLLLAGCGSCQQGPPSDLKVDGPTPYVRCLAADPPDDGESTVGSVKVEREDRVLTLTGLPRSAKVVAFGGPGPSEEPVGPVVSALVELSPDLVVVLGDLGDTEARAKATLAALASLEVPVLVVAGGRDDAVVWDEAWGSLDAQPRGRLLDVTPYRRVVVGAHELIPVAGAPNGRYARTDAACGHGPSDLEEAAEALDEEPAGERILLSWAAPAGWAVGLEGADAGGGALGELAETAGVTTGLYAFPPGAGAPGDADPVRVGVRPLVGPAVVGPDGTRVAAGPTALELGPEGLKISD